MKKRLNRILALFLASTMVIGMVPMTASAEETAQTESVSQTASEATDVTVQTEDTAQESAEATEGEQEAVPAEEQSAAEEAQIEAQADTGEKASDITDPELAAVAEELETIRVAPEDSDATTPFLSKEAAAEITTQAEEQTPPESVPLTEEEKAQILEAYKTYLEFIEANPNYFGIRTPYFANKDTDASPLGSMLIVIGISQKAIDGGYVKASDLLGAIQLFDMANQFGVKMLGEQMLAVKDQALASIQEGMTVQQKLLALNDWLANWCTFDMAYIMEMEAPEPVKSDLEVQLSQAVTQALTQQLMDEYGMSQEEAEATAAEKEPELTANILGAWKGNQFGALCTQQAVCLGYSYAYTYLVQWAMSDVYQNEDGSWKTKTELNYVTKEVTGTDEEGNETTTTEYEWSAGAPYMVDFVRIQYDAEVTMFGEPQDNFDSEHYWNAVKVDGKWYYVDPCYTDIFIECMSRDRVEVDGNMNHIYFMISDDSVRQLYDGNYKDIDTLYEGIATDKTYEDAWFAFAKSPIYAENGQYYYFYDSTDVISQMGSMGGMQAAADGMMGQEDAEYKLVSHDGSLADSDATFTTYIDFTAGTVLDPASGKMVESELIKELYAEQEAYAAKYPSIAISGAVSNGVFYFSIANRIMSYNLESGEIATVKEYNEVTAERDLSVALGGMAFTVTNGDSEEAVETAEDGTTEDGTTEDGSTEEVEYVTNVTTVNNPLASMAIKDDGKMYVSVGTNYGWISGKANMEDESSAGYEFEETNYNPDYSSFMANLGYGDEINDNDEFMWSAVLVDTMELSHLTGEHTYEKVTVAPTCGKNGYTEERCTTCGAVKADSREEIADSALEHHFVKFDEQYYTKDDSDNFNTGSSYVCTICKDAKDELEEGDKEGHVYTGKANWAEDYSTATMTIYCDTCDDKNLDCLIGDETIVKNKDVEATVTGEMEGTCTEGGTITYTAKATVDEVEYTDTTTVKAEPGDHNFGAPTFEWADDGETCTATLVCTKCGEEEKKDCKVEAVETKEPTCTEPGTVKYKATVEGTEYTDEKTVENKKATGHTYDQPAFQWADDHKTCTATFTCKTCGAAETKDCEIKESDKKDATCTEKGSVTYTASCEMDGKTYTSEGVKAEIAAKGHKYEVAYKWADDYKTCTAVFTCANDKKHQEEVKCDVSKQTVEAKNTYTATCTFEGKTYTDTKSKEIKLPFTDVNKGDWYYNSVAYVYDNKLMTGLTETTFGPGETLCRAQMAVILYRMEGSPKVTGSNPFPDVSKDAYYYNAAIWANQNKIITGYSSNGKFGGGDNLTREQMATILYRYSNYKGYDTSKSADISTFPDANQVNDYAKQAMQWAVATEIIKGNSNGTLAPQDVSARCVCAIIIERYLTNVK